MPIMKAVVCRTTGPPDSLVVSDEPLPSVGDDELLVRVVGAGVNPVDWKTRAGTLPAKLPKVCVWCGGQGGRRREQTKRSSCIGAARPSASAIHAQSWTNNTTHFTNHTSAHQILGGDVAGVVVQPDAGAAFAAGDRVFAMTRGFKWDVDTNGCYAERVAVVSFGMRERWRRGGFNKRPRHASNHRHPSPSLQPVKAAAKAPTTTSLLHAAAVPLVALTAAQTIALAPKKALAAGGKALVTAGAGGVGHVAVQLLAKVRGLHVVATASPANTDFLKSVGAAATLDYSSPSFADNVAAAGPYATVFDLVGGDQARAAWGALAPGGAFLHVFNTGTSDELVADGKAAAAANGWTWVGPTLVQEDGDTLTKIAVWIDAGKLAVDVGAVLPLEQAGLAHAQLEGLHVRGKLVLKVGEEEE